MAKQEIDIGIEGNDGTGDSIRESFRKVNENFTELYAVFGVEGSLSFLSLSDTPQSYEENKILTTNSLGNAVIFSSLTSNDGTINIDVISTPGKINLGIASIKIVQDTESPTLGNHLSAANFAIGGVQVSEAAAAAINGQEGRSTNYTIDDLVITKGYADSRYFLSNLPIRVEDEPETIDQYTLTINSYNGQGHLVFNTGHGFDRGANGTAFVFNSQIDDPSGLVSGETYYIRYESSIELSLFSDQDKAREKSANLADPFKITVSGVIAPNDVHTITDAGLDTTLKGNFLSDSVLPRNSITRRQGDTMEGALYLYDHPGDLAGSGAPTGADDLQAATKYYVDNTAYSSPEVLFVSTSGDDNMNGVPFGKEGTANTYAFRTINAAAQRAAELIETSPEEPGPYFQTLTYGTTSNNLGTPALTTSAGVENGQNVATRLIIQNNRQYIIKEITGFIAFTYPDFAYDEDQYEKNIGLILDAVSFDVNRGNNANYLSRQAAQRYYSTVEGRIAITSQLERTDAAFAKTAELVQSILQNGLLASKTVTAITKRSGNTPAQVTTSTEHGLLDGNQVIFKDIAGMTEIEGEIVYIRKVDNVSFELFSDADLTIPYDNASYTTFVNDNNGIIGIRYQQKYSQDVTVPALSTSDNGYVAVTQNFSLIRNIIRNGIAAGADIVFGNRYILNTDNSSAGILDQTNPRNIDALPGKVIRGKRSGAIGRIITFEQDTNNTTFYLQPLEARDFEPGEELEMGNYVKARQVVIRVEAGIYEEDLPIKLTKNVSLKGDEFRRVIIRPKRRVSQSPYANTYFYRDKEFDGLTLLNTGTPFINQTNDLQGYFGYHYLTDNTRSINVGAEVNNVGGYLTASNIIRLNKEFIQEEVGEYVDATYPGFFSVVSKSKYLQDIGTIVDAIVQDLRRGRREFTLEAQGEYYTSALTPGTEAETVDAISYISSIASVLLAGSAPATIRGEIEVDLSLGAAETTWAPNVTYSQGDFVKTVRGGSTFYYKAKIEHISDASDQETNELDFNYLELTNTQRWENVPSSTDVVGDLVDTVNFAFDAAYNPPKRNDADGVDVFLMDDATIIRNVTVQGHGGFMCVLDPEGQILTKSPYIQTASSFSRSRNTKAFSGGMFVDAFCGNMPMRIQANSGSYTDSGGSVALNAFTLYVESQDVGGEPQGLKLRLPELPAPFYFEGIRYQVNAISNYDSSLGRAVIYLDPSSGNQLGWNKSGTDDIGDPGHNNEDVIQDISLQTAGNRSILGNDFTQINDLGYGLVTTNGAFSEMVSMFTYYCHAAYYAANGSEIRSLNGSNGYGNFGLVAEGADPNEIPDEVTTLRNMVQPIQAFTDSGFTNAADDTTITVYNFREPPMANSYIYIDHGGLIGALNYRINRVENLADPNNEGILGIGKAGAVVVTGINAVDNTSVTGSIPSVNQTFSNIPQKSTSGSGIGAKFTITITSGSSAVFTVDNVGSGYDVGDTITISGVDIGGVNGTNDLTITVLTVYKTTSGTYVDPQRTGSVTSATRANPVVITSNGHNLNNGDKIIITGVGGMDQLNSRTFYVGNVTTNTFALYQNRSRTIPLDGTEFDNFTSAGTWTSEGGIGNHVYRLSLQEATSNNDYFGELQDGLDHGDYIEYRHGENFIFTGVANAEGITERPSTAINFDESDLITYRSTGFTRSDDQGQLLGIDEIKSTVDSTYNFVTLEIDLDNVSVIDPDNGARRLGSQVGDTKIAVTKIGNTTVETRIVQDSRDSANQDILLPGDSGYSGGMTFAYAGKVFQVIDYQPIDSGAITNITTTNPIVVTSAGHGLSNGNLIEFRKIEGMTQLNGIAAYVGNVTPNTFSLFTDSELSNGVNGTNFSTYVSGGQWAKSDSIWYIEVQDYQENSSDWDITGTANNTGIKSAFTSERDLWLGVPKGTTAEITISISLCRATGHDFTQIGTGGFNSSNYPNVLLGSPTEQKAPAYSDQDNASKAQVWERRKGRVFFVTTDENGFFRVGKYFVVDQSTGSITFSGEVGISRAASLGFRDGVVINEFSNDELFVDLSDTAVPTEKAVANYISRRLGHNGIIQLTGSSRFEPGFLALNGSTPMESALDMNSFRIENLLDPVDDNDAATKDYVNQAVNSYDELDDLRNIAVHPRVGSDRSKQIFVPTGKKRIVVDPSLGTGTISPGDTITDGSSTGTVVATESRFDYVQNKNVQIISYTPLVGEFSITLGVIYVGSPGIKSATVLENPIEEFANAIEKSTSDINITVSRGDTSPFTEIDLQIEPQAIIDSDINNDARISQSKLMMLRAKPLANSNGLFGTDNNATTGRTGQSNRGLVAFEYKSFAEDVELTFNNFISADVGDVIIQGSSRGYVVNSITNSLTVVVRTSDTFVVSGTIIQRAIVDADGVEGTANTLSGREVTQVLRSGYISLKDRGIQYEKFPNLSGATLGIGGSVIGRATNGNGTAEQVSFADVIDQGLGLADGDFTTERPYSTSGSVNDPGEALIQFGTSGGGTYAYTNIAYDNAGNTLAKRDNNGKLHVTSLIIGGSSSYEVLTESSQTLNLKTPDQGIVLTASGSDKPTLASGGKIKVGEINNVDDSTFFSASNFGVGQDTPEVSALASRWIYSSFIEAPDEKGSASTGIGIGAGTGFTEGVADTIIFVTNGSVRARFNDSGLQTNSISSLSANTNLTLSANGTGVVNVADTLETDDVTLGGTITKDVAVGTDANILYGQIATNDYYRIRAGGANNAGYLEIATADDGSEPIYVRQYSGVFATVTRTLTLLDDSGNTSLPGGLTVNNSITSGTANTDLTLSGNGTGIVSISDGLKTDSITSGTSNTDLTLSGNGTGVVYVSDSLKTTSITTGGSSTAGTITGNWSLTTGSRLEATYADLAEYYESDQNYESGTVLVFGGNKEVTQSLEHRSRRVAGVVSTNPAYTMNNECPGIKTAVALQGRVPVKVIGVVQKGDMLVSSGIPGYAVVDNDPRIGTVIGKAVGEKLDADKGIVEVVVGRL